MKKLRVLWFEDNFNSFTKILPNLIAHTKINQRIFEHVPHGRYPDDFDIMLYDGEFSLAFIDLNLKNGQKGIEIVKILRERGAYIDTLLYSNNPHELIQLTEGENYIEGIFRHATLTGIEQKMKDVIDQVIYKETMTIHRHELETE